MEIDNDGLPSKAFDIFEDIGNYDPKDSPSNGYEYLYQVIHESSKVPQTLVANLNLEKFRTNQTYYIPDNKTSDKVDQVFIPTEEWKLKQLRHFIVVKDLIRDMKLSWKKKRQELVKKIQFPDDIEREDDWLKFCTEKQPLMTVLFEINQTGLDKLLNYFTIWFEDNLIQFTQNTGMWLFSIFACLEEPLTPIICANLRTITRLAKKKRATLDSTTDEMLIPLNVIICIAVKYFKQTDLGE